MGKTRLLLTGLRGYLSPWHSESSSGSLSSSAADTYRILRWGRHWAAGLLSVQTLEITGFHNVNILLTEYGRPWLLCEPWRHNFALKHLQTNILSNPQLPEKNLNRSPVNILIRTRFKLLCHKPGGWIGEILTTWVDPRDVVCLFIWQTWNCFTAELYDGQFWQGMSLLYLTPYFKIVSHASGKVLWVKEGSLGKGACSQAWEPEFDLQDPHGGRRALQQVVFWS